MAEAARSPATICRAALSPSAVPSEWSGVESLERAVAALRERFDGLAPAPISDSEIERALRRLIDDAQLTARQVELCCAGILRPVAFDGGDGDEMAIADSSVLTERLLERLDALERRAAASRSVVALTRSLLAGEPDPHPARRRNLERLGEGVYALGARKPDAIRPTVRELLARVEPIVSGRDVSGLVPAVLDRRHELLADLLRLKIPWTSWVWAELTDRAAAAAEIKGAVEYRRLVPALIEWLTDRRREHLLDRGLGRIVKHLAAVGERDEVPEVRDLTIERWGNPHLESNHQRWRERATEAGRRLVASWVTRQVIDLFFNTLAGYGNPQGRSSYWNRHAEEIDELWVYASRTLASDMSADARALRALLGRRLCRLTHEHETNAFVMRIGAYVFAEFSTSDNALYVYERGDLPQSLGMDASKAAVFKDRVRGRRIRHQGRWQEEVDGWIKRGIATRQ